MKILWAVVKDLVGFVWEACVSSDSVTSSPQPILPDRAAPLALTSEIKPVLLEASPPPRLLSEAKNEIGNTTASPHMVYVQVESAPLFLEARLQVDGVVSYVTYGTACSVVGEVEQFWRVTHGVGSAWIEKNMVQADRQDIYPALKNGNCYLALDTETKKLRQFIKDEFYGTRVHSPLLGVEYVTYRLFERGQHIDWSSASRPRPAGIWHQLLRGNRNVVIKIGPKTGSLLESGGGDNAFLAYVESVSPDEIVTISSVGRHKPGQYLEEVLTKESWQALQPLWLQIS